MSAPEPHEGWFPIYEESIRLIERTFDREGARRKAMAALLAVSRIVNLEGKNTFTRRIASIANDMSYSYPHAAEALHLLASAGIITIKSQSVPNSKEKAPSVYTLEQNVLRLEPCSVSRGGPRVSNNLQEQPKNNQDEILIESDFSAFWDSYPRKVSKPSALKAWKKATLPPLTAILSALEAHKASDQWQDQKFIPHPATWINGCRWLDEISAKTQTQNDEPKFTY